MTMARRFLLVNQRLQSLLCTFVWSRAQTNKVGGYGFMVNPTLRHRILFRHVRNVYYFTDIFMIKLLLITVRYLCHKFIIYCIYIPCQSINAGEIDKTPMGLNGHYLQIKPFIFEIKKKRFLGKFHYYVLIARY